MKVLTRARPADLEEDEPAAEPVRRSWRTRIMPSTRRARLIAAACTVVVAAAATTQIVVDELNQLPDGAAFELGDQVVTAQELQQRTDVLKALYGIQPPTAPDQADKFARDTAKAVAVSNILDNAAQAEGIVVADKTASDQLATVVHDNYNGDRNAFLKALGDKGVSEQHVLDEIKRQLRNAQLFARVTGGAKQADDAAAQAYYNAHKAQMVSPEQRDIRNIVVTSQDQAAQIAQQARTGADFAALANQYSLDGQTKQRGGELGMVASADLDRGYAATAFATPAGQVFGPVHTQSGWNVGQIAKIQPAVPLSFAQLKDAIKAQLGNDTKMAVWRNWLGGKIKDAHVRYAPSYQPADPDSPPQQQPAGS
ncbi:MAG TPA: peptidyl-prolyl cis-trans isomerase [Amycolatopsis sp.]|nr:peptidyl-prolyl cis-trans isomerase [Amycolatopsis sp.]